MAVATDRAPLPLFWILAALPVALLWACGSSDEPQDEWPDLPGSGGAGGASTTSSGDTTSSAGGAGGAGGTGGTGGAGGEGSTGGAGGEGGAGGGGDACEDPAPSEPNETEAMATYLGMITDDDDEGGSFTGTLVDASDVDWFTYDGVDVLGYTVDPSRSFSAGLFRVCKFVECINGAQTDVTCEGGSTAQTSPEGRSGCCHTSAFSIDVDCVGEDDDTTVFIRVDQPTAACASYTISYHY